MKKITKEYAPFTLLGGEESSIRTYFNEISKLEPLSRVEERELFKRAKLGDKKAFKKIIESNLKFVIMVSKRYVDNTFSLNDLKSVGTIGLINSINTFDEERGVKFITYATWYIQKEITDYTRNCRFFRIPQHKIPVKHKMDHSRKEFINTFDKEPSLSELELFYDSENTEHIEWDYLTSKWHISLDNSVPNERNDEVPMSYSELLSSPESNIIDENDDKEYLRIKLSQLMKFSLSSKEREIITKLFNLNNNLLAENEEKVAKEYSLSRERIRQIKEEAIKKMRKNAINIKDFIL